MNGKQKVVIIEQDDIIDELVDLAGGETHLDDRIAHVRKLRSKIDA